MNNSCYLFMIKVSTRLDEILKLQSPCSCNSCNNGCKFGSGVFTDDQIKSLAKFLNKTEKQTKEQYLEKITKLNTTLFKPKIIKKKNKPYGRCIFFNNNKCDIHKVKPLECKIAMPCKEYGEDLIIWFMLNYFLDKDDIESLRQWKIHIEIGGKKIPGSELNELTTKQNIKKIDSLKDSIKVIDKDWKKVLGI